MSAALGDPYLLTTYGSPPASRKGKEKEVVRDARPFVFASHCTVPKRDEGHVTLAVQGDGIHVFEVRISPSHTLLSFLIMYIYISS